MRLDIDSEMDPDIVASIADLSDVATARYDAIWSSHNIEHLFHHEARAMVAQLKRVLKAEGWAIVTNGSSPHPQLYTLRHNSSTKKTNSDLGYAGLWVASSREQA